MVGRRALALTALCLAAGAALFSCKPADGGADGFSVEKDVRQAVENYNLCEMRSTGFSFSLARADSDENTFFLQGTVSSREGAHPAFSGRVTAIGKGEAATSSVYYKAGAYYRDTGKGAYYTVTDSAAAFRSFFCTRLPLPDEGDISGACTAEAAGGTKYSYKAKRGDGALAIFEERLYGHCGLKRPRRDKTECEGAEYVYVVDADGVLKSAKISLTVALYDTAPYYPNYSVPDADLRRVFRAELELKVKALGESVEITQPDTAKFTFLG